MSSGQRPETSGSSTPSDGAEFQMTAFRLRRSANGESFEVPEGYAAE